MEQKSKPYHHGNLRQTLFDNALVYLKTHGPEELSLREIARASGVSPNAPYRHFKTKDDLLASLSAYGFEQLAEALSGIREDGPVKRFRALGDAFEKFAAQHGPLFRLMFSFHTGFSTDSPLEQARAQCFSLVAESVRVVMDEVTVNEKVRQSAIAAWSLFYGFSTLAIDRSYPLAAATSPEGRDIARVLARGLRD